MSITIEQAVTLASVFKDPRLQDTVNGGAKIDHLKQLSEADRKICITALKMIEEAQLSDWDKEAPADKIDDARIRDISAALVRDLADPGVTNTPWYKKPFVWIAKQVHSFVLGFKNIFMGRVSSKKLYVEASNYLTKVKESPEIINKLQANIIELKREIESSQREMAEIENKYDAFEARRGILYKIKNRARNPARPNQVVINEAHRSIGEELHYDIRTYRQIVRETLQKHEEMIGDVKSMEDEAEITKSLLTFKDLFEVANKSASDVASVAEQRRILYHHLNSSEEKIKKEFLTTDELRKTEEEIQSTRKMIRDLEVQAENELESETKSQCKTLDEWLSLKIKSINEPWNKICGNFASLKEIKDLAEKKIDLLTKQYV